MSDLNDLRSSLDRLEREAHRRVGNWDWDILNNELTWNRITFEIFKIKPKEFAGTYEGFLDTVHEEDVQAVKTAVDNALEKAEPYCIVHRIILPDKSEGKVMEKADVYFNKNGKPTRMVGTVTEIMDNGNPR